MTELTDVEYLVILMFPSSGTERENAEQIVQEALDFLNIPNYEPGMRFAPNVKARLELLSDVDDARDRLRDDDDLAMMILHDLDEDEKTALTRECADKGVLVCHTEPGRDKPRPKRARDGKRPWKIVFSEADPNQPRAHRIAESTLTGPLEDDPEELGDRIGQMIMVLALGVMEHHFSRTPRRFRPPE